MEKLSIKVNLREKSGKEIAKKERRQGLVPAVVYGRDLNISVQIPLDSLKVLNSIHFSESTIIDMDIPDNKDNGQLDVLIKDVQYHPLTDKVIHIDFIKVSLTEKIRVKIPISLSGDCKGVKEGGVLEHMLWEVEIETLPTNIPEKINVDISQLDIGHSIHVADLKISEDIKILNSVQETIATVVAIKEEVEEEEVIEEETQEPIATKEKDKEPKQEKE